MLDFFPPYLYSTVPCQASGAVSLATGPGHPARPLGTQAMTLKPLARILEPRVRPPGASRQTFRGLHLGKSIQTSGGPVRPQNTPVRTSVPPVNAPWGSSKGPLGLQPGLKCLHRGFRGLQSSLMGLQLGTRSYS